MMSLHSDILEPIGHKKALIALILSTLLASIPMFFIYNLSNEGDVFTHYYISLGAWKKPSLILDLWGRPLFTLSTMPFALAGFHWLKVYTLILAVLTAWFSYLSVRKLAFTEPWVVIPLVIFTPIYFYLLLNPLTETLMAFLLVLSIYLFVAEKYELSALVAGFIPFARLEAFVIFPVFILVFLIHKKFKPILLLFTGYAVFGCIGYYVMGDFLWFISKNPYTSGATDIYGKGELFHFVLKTPSILGYPLAFLFLAGISLWIFKTWPLPRMWGKVKGDFSVWLLLTGTYLAYLAAHSYAWWSGKGNSLGLIRVMGAVTPVAAILATVGLHFIGMELGKIKIKDKHLALFASFLVALPMLKNYHQYHPSAEEVEIKRACEWLKSNNFIDRKLYYFHPLVGILTSRGAFEDSKGAMKVHFASFNADEIEPEAVVLWDGHFGPNEGQLPIEALLENQAFKLLVEIKPEHPFQTLGGHDFKIFIFERIKSYKLKRETDTCLKWFVIKNEGFENSERKFQKNIDSSENHKSRFSYLMNEKDEFFEFFNSVIENLDLTDSDSTLRAGVWIKPENQNCKIASLVIDLKMKDTNRYLSTSLKEAKISEKGWLYLDLAMDLKRSRAGDRIKVYIWNKGKEKLYIDDFTVGIGMKN